MNHEGFSLILIRAQRQWTEATRPIPVYYQLQQAIAQGDTGRLVDLCEYYPTETEQNRINMLVQAHLNAMTSGNFLEQFFAKEGKLDLAKEISGQSASHKKYADDLHTGERTWNDELTTREIERTNWFGDKTNPLLSEKNIFSQ